MRKTCVFIVLALVLLCLAACGITEPEATTRSTDATLPPTVTEVTTSEASSEVTSVTTSASTETTPDTTTETTTEPTTADTTAVTEPEPVDTPADRLQAICAQNDTVIIAYYSIYDGETVSLEVNSEDLIGRCSSFFHGYEWQDMPYFPEMKNMFPEIYRVTVSACDGSEKLEVSQYNFGGVGSSYVLYQNSDENLCWNCSGEISDYAFVNQLRSVFYDFEVEQLDVSVDGWYGPESACEYFAETAFFESRYALSFENNYRFVDYELISFEVTGVREDKTAVSGSMSYAFKPDNWESPLILAGNARIGTEEYEGYLIEGKGFILELGDDGKWHCTGLGTGGYSVN
ncbi:MAG: hypothetical protein IKZ19_00445 [Clostridia bacterium]|nr:hypothetical protein [Clostridia bacterium]